MSNSKIVSQFDEFVPPRYALQAVIANNKTTYVFRAHDIDQDQIVAIKFSLKSRPHQAKETTKHRLRLLQCEVSAMRLCNSNTVVKIYDFFDAGNYKAIVMEFCDQPTLAVHIAESSSGLGEEEALIILRQLACGLQELQCHNIIHRDLKPQNIFRSANCFKIGDLGFARVLETPEDLLDSCLGTYSYMAPEILAGQKYGVAADMWSLGVILYYMIERTLPFVLNGKTLQQMMEVIRTTPVKFTVNSDTEVKQSIKQLIKRMITINPQERIKWQEFYKHPLLHRKALVSDVDLLRLYPKTNFRSKILSIQSGSDRVEESFHSNQEPQPEMDRTQSKPLPKHDPMEETSYTRLKGQSVEESHSRILDDKQRFRGYCAEVRMEITKLDLLLKHVIEIEKHGFRKAFRKSRRITELQLLVAMRCMKKAESLERLFHPEKVTDTRHKYIFRFEDDKAFRSSEEWAWLESIYDVSYEVCMKEYRAVSQRLFKKEEQGNNIIKDFFFRLSDRPKYDRKQAFINGIQDDSYDLEEHTNFVLEYFEEIYPRFERIQPHRITYCLFAVMKHYKRLARYGGDPRIISDLHEQLKQTRNLLHEQEGWKKQIAKLKLFR